MESKSDREIIIAPQGNKSRIESIVRRSNEVGIRSVLCDPSLLSARLRRKCRIYGSNGLADILVTSTLQQVRSSIKKGRSVAFEKYIERQRDVDELVKAAKEGARAIIIGAGEWKIIPLENIIAELRGVDTTIIAKVTDPSEIPTMFAVLEKGVQGVLVPIKTLKNLDEVSRIVGKESAHTLKVAKVVQIKDGGNGERACIDTASLLQIGDGMLIGSRSGFLFLIHNEAIGSQFTSARPFRVNAGAIHSYILLPDGKTKYLSEMETGMQVLITNSKNKSYVATVGRVKIERRPLKLVKAACEGEEGSALVQNAETIRFVGKNGTIIPVTELKVGQEILVHHGRSSARHFGMAVDEFIVEK
ncbi:MAG: 3-dehydroquinate synthase II [Nitrososphaerales archaeon]